MAKMKRRPSRSEIATSLRGIELLWRPPDKEKAALGANPAALQITSNTSSLTSGARLHQVLNRIVDSVLVADDCLTRNDIAGLNAAISALTENSAAASKLAEVISRAENAK